MNIQKNVLESVGKKNPIINYLAGRPRKESSLTQDLSDIYVTQEDLANLSSGGGGNGLFDAANDGETIAITELLQDDFFQWNAQNNELEFIAVPRFYVEGNGSDQLRFISPIDGYGSLYFFAEDRSADNFGHVTVRANPEEGFAVLTNNFSTNNASFIQVEGNAGDITIETPDDKTIKVGSNTYFERGENSAIISAEGDLWVEANSLEQHVRINSFDSNLTLGLNSLSLTDGTSNKQGLKLVDFGEDNITGIGGDYSTLLPNSLVPKAYVDAQRPYKAAMFKVVFSAGAVSPTVTELSDEIGMSVTFASAPGVGSYILGLSMPVGTDVNKLVGQIMSYKTTPEAYLAISNLAVNSLFLDASLLTDGSSSYIAGTTFVEVRVYN